MKEFEVWSEGYSATGEHGNAQQLYNSQHPKGKWPAKSFKDACLLAMQTLKWDMKFYNAKQNTYWACKFYDNAKAARASFG